MKSTKKYRPRLYREENPDSDEENYNETDNKISGSTKQTFYSDNQLYQSKGKDENFKKKLAEEFEEEFKDDNNNNFKSSSGRLEGGRIKFEETFDEFQNITAEELEKKFRPPYEPDLETSEIQEMLNW